MGRPTDGHVSSAYTALHLHSKNASYNM